MSTSETITRTDLANILNDILPVYNSTGFTVEKFTASSATSVSANGGTAWIQVRIPSGYEPVCIVGYYLNGGSGCSVYNEAIAKDSNGYYCSFALRNGQSSVNTVTIDAYVLCKQSLTHFTQAMADYIVEQGTSGGWTYRKWNSGIAECWGLENKASATLNANGYLSFNVSLPSFFVNEVPIATGSGGATGHVRTFLAYTKVAGSSGAYFIDSYMLSTDSSSAMGVWAYYNVKGKWK